MKRFQPDDQVLVHQSRAFTKACKLEKGRYRCLVCGTFTKPDAAHVVMSGAEANKIADENRTKPRLQLLSDW